MGIVDFKRFVGDSLYNFVNGLGTTKDSRTHSVYSFAPLDRSQLEIAYRSDWIARAIVEAPAEDITREWREWQAEQSQIEKLENAEKALNLQNKLKKAIVLARLYGGSALVLGVKVGMAEEPLDLEKVGQDDLVFVEVFHQFELTPGQRILDVNSPWFNRPSYYQLGTDTMGVDGDRKQISAGVRIHPSRVIALVGNELPDIRSAASSFGWGDSVLQVVDNAVKSADTVIDGVSAMIHDAKMDVVKVPGLTNKMADDNEWPRLLRRFQLANQGKSSINTLLLDEKEEWQRITTSFAGLPDLIEKYLRVVSGAAKIPSSRLMGGARSKGLGGSEGGGEVDLRNYYDSITSQQKNEISPALTTLDEVFIRSVLGTSDDSVYYEWRPLWQLDEGEKAAIALQKAQATQADVTMALINPDALRRARINQLIEDGTYPGIEDAIDEFGEEPEEPEVTPEDVQNHIGMMQKSASQLKTLGAAATDPSASTEPASNSQFLDAWSEASRAAALEARRRKAKPQEQPSEFKSTKSGDMIGWHGGSSAILDSVRKKGITIGEDKRAWMAANKSTASLFAETKAKAGYKPIVFEVNVPHEKWSQFQELKVARTASSTQKIPPEWIVGYHEVDKKTGKLGSLKSMMKDASAVETEHRTAYVVVLPDKDDDTDMTDAWSDAARAAALEARRNGGTTVQKLTIAHASQSDEIATIKEQMSQTSDPEELARLKQDLKNATEEHSLMGKAISKLKKAPAS